MLFSSITFLFYFLPFSMIGYFILKDAHRNLFLWLLSLFFYAWGEPFYVVLLLASTIVDFQVARYMEKHPRKARRGLLCSIIVNLLLLAFFKYTPLLQDILSYVSLSLPFKEVALPLGISFYTFQTMSYTIDVYRKKVKANEKFIDFAMYVALFPQLIAGPIVRYSDVAHDLSQRSYSFEQCERGFTRFILGLAKKLILANTMGVIFEELRILDTVSLFGAWLAMVAFAFQIYFDFSGYSDMAIGLGTIFGFHFPENFKYPYIAKSISDFWQRWHISLTTWFKEYVYIPLGGNRSHPLRNLWIVWFLCGLWHGASWNFILWGMYFGSLLIIEKYVLKKYLEKIPNLFRHMITLFLVLVGWTIFAFEDGGELLYFLNRMFLNPSLWDSSTLYIWEANAIMFILCSVLSMPILPWLKAHFKVSKGLRQVFVILLLIECMAYLSDATYNPFLYFRF